MTIVMILKAIIDYLNSHPAIKTLVIVFLVLICFIFFVNIFSKFLQNLDYLISSLKRHFVNLTHFIRFILKWILTIIFMPISYFLIKQEYFNTDSKIINNSRFKDVSKNT